MSVEIVKPSISKSAAIRHSCSTIERCCMTLPRSRTVGWPCCVFLEKVNPLRVPPPCPKREHDKHCDGLTNLETQGLGKRIKNEYLEQTHRCRHRQECQTQPPSDKPALVDSNRQGDHDHTHDCN